jgi:ATP-dependent Clp protease adapter protein ClpS
VRSFKHERIYVGRKTLGLIHYRGKTLCIAFASDVKEFAENKHNLIDMSEVSRYVDTPLMMRINSSRKNNYVIDLLRKLFEKEGIEDRKITIKEEKIPTKSKKTLIKEGLIKNNK